MTSDSQTDNTPSKSLGESWATLSVSDAHSEDGTRSEQTDVGSLIDPAGPDDVASLDDRYTSSEIDGRYDEDENASTDNDAHTDEGSLAESHDLPPLFPQDQEDIDGSNITTKAVFHPTTDSMQLSESEKSPTHVLPFSYSSRVHELAPALRLLTLTFFSAIALAVGISALQVVIACISQIFAPVTSGLVSSSTGIPMTAPPLAGARPHTSSVQYPTTQKQTLLKPIDCTSKAEELMGLTSHAGHQPGDRNKFEVQVVGDCHVVIKLPAKLDSTKRPNFKVTVKRREEIVPYELSRLFDGVYTLKLNKEDAHGVLNVTISAFKPPLNHVTQVDFGVPWLKVANWKRAAQAVSLRFSKDLKTAYTNGSKIQDRLSAQLQELMGEVMQQSQSLREEAAFLQRKYTQLSRVMGDAVMSRSRQLSETFQRNAAQHLKAASSVVKLYNDRFSQEAKEIVGNAWTRVNLVTEAVDVRDLVDKLRSADDALGRQLDTMLDRLRSIRKDRTLGLAQTRARQLMGLDTCQGAKCSTQKQHR